MFKTQVPAPEPSPPHPRNTAPDAGVAVKVVLPPLGKYSMHCVPQLIPPVEVVTVPEPVFVTTSARAKVTPTVLSRFIVTLPVTLVRSGYPFNPQIIPWVVRSSPASPEPQLVTYQPGAAVIVRVTPVPSGYIALQLEPQLIPAGEEVTVPWPVTATLNW